MANDIDIKVKVDASGAITALDQTGKVIKETSVAAESASSSFSAMTSVLEGIGQAVGQRLIGILEQLPGTIVEFAKRGSDVDDMAQAFGRLSDQAGTTANVLLGQLKEATAGTISDFDLMQRSNEALNAGLKPDQLNVVAQAARALGETFGGDLKDNFDGLLNSLEKGDDRWLKQHGILIDNQKAYEEFARSIGTTGDKLNELGKAAATQQAVLEALAQQTQNAGAVTDDTGDAFNKISAAITNAKDQISVAIGANEQFAMAINAVANAFSKIDFYAIGKSISEGLTVAINGALTAINKANTYLKVAMNIMDATSTKTIPEIAKSFDQIMAGAVFKAIVPVDDLVKSITSFGVTTNSVVPRTSNTIVAANRASAASYVSHKDAAKSLLDVNKEFKGKIDDLITQLREESLNLDQSKVILNDLEASYIRAGGSAQTFAKILNNETSSALDSVNNLLAGNEKKSGGQSFSDGLIKSIFGLGDGEFGNQVAGAVSDLVGNLFSSLSDGFQRADSQEIGKAVGSAIGTAIGAYYGGTAGAAAGASIGNVLGGFVASIFEGFGKDSAGTRGRKALDKYFAELFDGDRLRIIIDGQLQKIGDLQFTGNQESGIFGSLNTQAQQAFSGVATAFEHMFGVANDLGVNLGYVLANNLGGSLNNLQLLIQGTGKSFEELKDQVVNAFLEGQLSIDETNSAIAGLAQVFTDGIPDAIGAVDQAFQNLEAAGTKGGRALIDALKDVGYEAKELGIRDFGGLEAELKRRLPNASAEIDKLFAALQSSGIGSIDSLTKATAEQLLPVLGQLSAQKFPFAEQAKAAEDLVDKMNNIPKEINSRINLDVRTSFDDNTERFVESGGKLPVEVGSSPGR